MTTDNNAVNDAGAGLLRGPVAAPASPPDSIHWVHLLQLLILGAVGGGQFLLLRIAAPDFGPYALAEVRVLCAALVLSPALWHYRRAVPLHTWPMVALLGATMSAIPFGLMAWAALHAPAGVLAITNSTAVTFTWLVAAVFLGERIGGIRWISMFVGLAGVVVLVSAKTAGASFGLAAGAGVIAAIFLGGSVNLVKHLAAKGRPPIALAAAMMLAAAIELAPTAILNWPANDIALKSWMVAIALGTVFTGLASAFYFRLIGIIGAARAATLAYLYPAFGVAWGWMVLGEVPTLSMIVAGVLIIGSVLLAQRGR